MCCYDPCLCLNHHIYLSFGISISLIDSTFCEFNSQQDFFERFMILSAILLPIKSPVASAVFLIAFFQAVFIASIVDFLVLSKSF